MIKQTVLVLALAACISAAVLPVPRIPHGGPNRRFGLRHGRIIEGSPAEVGQFPYQVSVQWWLSYVYAHHCGGALVKPDAVVTAAQCVYDFEYGFFRAVAGIVSMKEEGPAILVTRVTLHPEFNIIGAGFYINDIAVLQLETGFTMNEKVNTKPFAGEGQPTLYEAATLSGWGSTDYMLPSETSETLQWAEVQVISDCLELLPDGSPFNDNNLCTGPGDDWILPCWGDIGSPLVQRNEIIGILSENVIACGSPRPAVYSKVSSFSNFIKETLQL